MVLGADYIAPPNVPRFNAGTCRHQTPPGLGLACARSKGNGHRAREGKNPSGRPISRVSSSVPVDCDGLEGGRSPALVSQAGAWSTPGCLTPPANPCETAGLTSAA